MSYKANIKKIHIELDSNIWTIMIHYEKLLKKKKKNKIQNKNKKNTKKISKYFTAYNDTLSKLDNNIQQMEKKANDGEIPIKEVKDIIPDSNKVNGKQQQKIEKFLKSIDIKTKAFER